MQLSKRLSAVAGFVTPGYKVADVGCDHAFTSIYLVANHISPQVIAMDVNLGPLERAKENIEKYKVEDRIIIRRSDGIKELEPGEVDSVILAGMGRNFNDRNPLCKKGYSIHIKGDDLTATVRDIKGKKICTRSWLFNYG